MGRRQQAGIRQHVRRSQNQIPRCVQAPSRTDWRAPTTVSEDRILTLRSFAVAVSCAEAWRETGFAAAALYRANVVPYPPEPLGSALITASSAATLWLSFLLSSRAFAAICLTASNSSRVTTSIVARRRSS